MSKEKLMADVLNVIYGYNKANSEDMLTEMYNISRKCITLGIGVLEFVELYLEALKQFFGTINQKEINFLEVLPQFPLLREGLSPYELAYLSYMDSNKKLTHLSKHLEDEVKTKTKELNISKQQYQVLVENIPGIIYTCPDESPLQFSYISPKLEKIMGYKPAEWIKSNKVYLMQIHADDIEKVINEKFYAFNNSKQYNVEYRITINSGEIIWVLDAGHYVVGLDDKLHIQGIITDITEKKKMEKEMIREDRLENVRLLAENITHDFNNLLNLIIITTQDALTKDISEKTFSDLSLIQTTTTKASSLINKLLGFSRLTTENHEIIDTNRIIQNSEPLLRMAVKKSVTLNIEYKPGLSPVKIDPEQLEQVLINLVINANDSMPLGGTLTIKTEFELLPKTDDLGYISDSPYSIISVSDTGIGMSEIVKAKLFDPFFTTKPEGKGTGLGLSSAWRVINQAGGKIIVTSEIGYGTTFKIYLPPQQEISKITLPPKEFDLNEQTYTLLLVDDMESFRKPLSRLLSAYGFKIHTSKTAAEAIIKFQESEYRIDLVICDANLPDMDGTELAQKIKMLNPKVKVLHISGFISADSITKYNALDQDYLLKPFSVEELTSKISILLAPSV